MAEWKSLAATWVRSDPRRALLAGVVGVTVLYLLLIPVGVIGESNRFGSTEILLIAVIAAIASNLPERLSELSVGGFRATFQELRQRQETLEDQVAMLSVLLGGTVTYYEFEKLHFLAHDRPFMVRYSPRMIDELYRLDGLRYIRVLTAGGLHAIVDDNHGSEAEFDLKRYVDITERGRAYLEFREKYVQAAADEDWGRRAKLAEAPDAGEGPGHHVAGGP